MKLKSLLAGLVYEQRSSDVSNCRSDDGDWSRSDPLMPERVTPPEVVSLVSDVVTPLIVTDHSVPKGTKKESPLIGLKKKHPKHNGCWRLGTGVGPVLVITIKLGDVQGP